jgi:DMSO/TMAO reductase YedYZ molybdopterin-dependent catalytic subunit
MTDQKSVVTLRIPKRILATGIIVVVLVAAILIFWQVYPILNPSSNYVPIKLQPMNLTLVALNGTSLTLNESAIAKLESFTSRGGFKNSVGVIPPSSIGNYTGVRLIDLCHLVGGINSTCSVRVTASDGYSMVYTYNQVQGKNFTCFSPETGDEVQSNQPFTMILAYYKNGVNLTSDEGPLRLVIVGPEGLLTDGYYWTKWVTRLEIQSAIADWTLVLTGPYSDNMTRASFESGLTCKTAIHVAKWTDSHNNVWSGMPLWYLIGWIDDKGDINRMEFNDTLAIQGYTVKVINENGGYREFTSLRVLRNSNIIVANTLNGAPLPEQYWPLKLVGSELSDDEMLRNVVEIQVIFP